MNGQTNMDSMLEAIASVMIKSFFIGIGFLLIWVLMIMAVPDWAWHKHADLFGLSRDQIARVHYTGMLITKVGLFGLFLFPYLGIKGVLRK